MRIAPLCSIALALFPGSSFGALVNPILNPGFDEQTVAVGHNIGIAIQNWNSSALASNNLIRVDGTAYLGGPNTAHSGTNYYDSAVEGGFIWQAFTLVNPVENITFGAYFSAREPDTTGGYPHSSTISIWSSENWSGTSPIAIASQSFSAGDADGVGGVDAQWKYASNTISSLVAGTYYVRITLNNYTNVDSVSFTGTEVPEPGGAIAGLLLGTGLFYRGRRKP